MWNGFLWRGQPVATPPPHGGHQRLKIAYLVHDLNDAAVARRAAMLKAGGADLVLAGFRRGERAPDAIMGFPVIDLGQTEDGKLLRRMGSVLECMMRSTELREAASAAHVVMARNLEMLVLAMRVAGRRPVVYESLDIHRSLLGEGAPSRMIRGLERILMQRSRLLITSSPAFLRNYFAPRQKWNGPSLLLENKVLSLDEGAFQAASALRLPGPPWRIGWFGIIRCRKSFDMLAKLAAESEGRIEVVIRGRPSPREFPDFAADVANAPGVTFGGAYTAEELPRLYGEVHFAWAIDYFEEGLNSSWLLPNRLYEGGRHGVAAIALGHVETGAWLAERGVGLLVKEPGAELADLLERLTPEDYAGLAEAVSLLPRRDLQVGVEECEELVDTLVALAAQAA